MVSPRIGIHFRVLHSSMNSEKYKDIISSIVIPIFKKRTNTKVVYQQDRVPALFSLDVRTLLDNELPNRWIGRGRPFPCPPRSPDLTILDFWLWGDIHNRLYQRQVPKSLEDLEQRLTNLLKEVKKEINTKSCWVISSSMSSVFWTVRRTLQTSNIYDWFYSHWYFLGNHRLNKS